MAFREYLVILELKPQLGERSPRRSFRHVLAQSDSQARRMALDEAEKDGQAVRTILACGRA